MRLFLAHGFDNTTVETIASTAGVSHMTVFRHFPTKEDIVLKDEYDDLIVSALKSLSTEKSLMSALQSTILENIQNLSRAELDFVLVRTRLVLATPSLRARLWDEQSNAINRLLASLPEENSRDILRDRVLVSAWFAALTAAVTTWVEGNGTPDLSTLIERAFQTLSEGAQT